MKWKPWRSFNKNISGGKMRNPLQKIEKHKTSPVKAEGYFQILGFVPGEDVTGFPEKGSTDIRRSESNRYLSPGGKKRD